jgi:hypothetical protein
MNEQGDLGNKDISKQSEQDSSLAIKTRFLLPPHVEILLPGLMLTAAISALALHTGAKITYVTPLMQLWA